MAQQKRPRLTSSKSRSEAKRRVRGAGTAADVARHTTKAHRKSRFVILSSLAIVTFLILVIVAYHLVTTLPQLVPSDADASASVSLPFFVENKSTLFSMREVSLICKLDRGVFATEDGSQLITPSNPSQRPPIIAEVDGMMIDPGQHVEFRCDETGAIRNPRFSEQFKVFQSAEVRIEITYNTWPIIFWKKEYVSRKFRRSKMTGFRWVADDAN
jgi:hypothetical protein